jgi:hypothetical protein
MNYGVIDYRVTSPTTKGDYSHLFALVRQLIGQPVLFGGMSYPRELTINFGTPVEFKGPRKSTFIEGSYVLGAVGSAWRVSSAPQGRSVVNNAGLYSPHPLPMVAITEAELEKFLKQISGTTVRDVDIYPGQMGYTLRIGLSDGSLIEVFPTPDHFEIGANDPIPIPPPDWELFTPYKRYLRVGPGLQWGYLPSDEPEPKQN